ncbi:MAG: NHLP family bacteriocin export ABC transporter peptidase/permease/ATPase subunit [Clostridiales bacterium]|nr:NHLP family bacteriocin export ABC transporter peptidase/permease/ATPase subunit [Candidatus Cacconaster stercorequi]
MAEKIKQPITKGVAKVPVIMQLEALECGAASLCMILAYYNKWIPLEQVREDCGVSRDGSNARNVLKAARFYGLDAKGYRYEPETLKENGTFPCIIHWNFNHFVVLDGFKGGKAYLNDPAKGSYHVSMETFDESFTGICLQFEPTGAFVPSGKPKSMLSFAAKRLKGTGTAIAFTVLTGMIAALMGFVQPAFSRVFLDHLLTGKDLAWTTPFLLFLGGFNIIQIVMSALQAVYSLRINGKMAAVGNAAYMWKVLKMPMKFFSQRMAGDIQGRQDSNASIANTLIGTFAPLLLNTVMMAFYFVVMLRYSVILTVIGLASLAINAVVSQYISKKRINVTRVSMRDSAKLGAATVAGIEMIETIKASGAENGYFKKWSGYQASVNTQQVKFLKLNQYLGMIPQFVSTLANNAVLFLGVWLTMQGKFTVGMIMAFQGFLASFMSPAMTLVSAGQTLQEMRTQMERVDDVMEYPDDVVFDETGSAEALNKLSGNVEIKNLVFGYSPLAEPLIKDFNMTLKPGRSVAIVGASGCGKSTMSKLISGLYQPWSGEILFDGKPMKQIPKSVFRGSVAVVDQDIILFEDTIANNIKMWDDSIEDFEMILAAHDAQIHEDIMERPKGYQHRLIEGGKDFSGGQRQRLEIARALAQDPTIVILDEATSALDAKTEYALVKAVRDRGITCIVIAHRLSTIRSCDEIIVMEHGEIKDRGTHKELMESSEIYRDLVTAE